MVENLGIGVSNFISAVKLSIDYFKKRSNLSIARFLSNVNQNFPLALIKMSILAFLLYYSFASSERFFVITDLHYDIVYRAEYAANYLCHDVSIRGRENDKPVPSG